MIADLLPDGPQASWYDDVTFLTEQPSADEDAIDVAAFSRIPLDTD
jgi:hypothetical protein